jgi:N6-adenosine-specific RNA methylase IME4
MSLEDIMALPVADWTMPDSLLWLWTTNTHLPVALDVVKAWGYQYRTMGTWAKTHFGIGFWLRGQTEHLIFASKGDAKPRRTGGHGALGSRASTLICVSKRLGHSEKPEAAHTLIESICEGPYLEVFARKARPGWTSWGHDLGVDLRPANHPVGSEQS